MGANTPAFDLRSLAPGETGPIQAVFDQLSPRSRFLRFHTPTPRLTSRMLAQLADVRPGASGAVVASADGAWVGFAHWFRCLPDDAPGGAEAELSVAVADRWHSRGVGRELLLAAVASAREAGVASLVCHVLPENTPVLDWLGRLGGARVPGAPGAVLLPLPPPRASASPSASLTSAA